MSLLTAPEINPGLVGFLDQEALNNDRHVMKSEMVPGPAKIRPFLCLERVGRDSKWLPITTQRWPDSFLLKRHWRLGGPPDWRFEPQYLSRHIQSYQGPNSCFVQASRQNPEDRMKVTKSGLTAIRRELMANGRCLVLEMDKPSYNSHQKRIEKLRKFEVPHA